MPDPVERSAAQYAALLPHPSPDANKYTRGGLLVVGGSTGYPGAAVLASMAAARCGAGYVRLATPVSAASVARTHLLSIPVTACAERDGAFSASSADEVLGAFHKSRAMVLGCGMTACGQTQRFAKDVLAGTDKPVVLDADALNVLALDADVLACRRGCTNIVTPHEGEAARLLGRPVGDRDADVRELARTLGATVVLKGPGTLVGTPDGTVVRVAEGGPELAKAGSGDVLAGMVGAFLAQGLEPLDAATLAVYLHGRAGRAVARRLSDIAVMPEDLLDELGGTMRAMEEER